jgi:hypothetical protein
MPTGAVWPTRCAMMRANPGAHVGPRQISCTSHHGAHSLPLNRKDAGFMTAANKQSPWYPPDTPPVRPGLYKVRQAARGRSHWAWWDGEAWGLPSNEKHIAVACGTLHCLWNSAYHRLVSWAGVLK